MPPYNPTGTDDVPTITATDGLRRDLASATHGDPEGWLARIESVIERYPWETFLVAVGVGYALARKLR